MCQNWSFSHWDLPVGVTLGSAKGCSIISVGSFQVCTSRGHKERCQGQAGASDAPVKPQRGWHQS